ncbi:MAG: hypothetical protein IPH66_11345 [Crocinitomicaceae bacterium]|nr:hypothetical protein [Crocinitomicaceae bacterium]
MVESDLSTEGSEPAKVGTEEHEVHKRLIKWMSKHTIVKSKEHKKF